LTDPTPDPSVSVEAAARFLGVPEDEALELADPEGRVPLEVVRSRVGAVVVARELAKVSGEAGRLSGQLGEVRASNARLQKELKESVAERRRLTEEVLDLRAAAEERLMLMERVEQMARLEQDLEESSGEVERLRNRGLLGRLLNRQ
jgi:predicted RNase H-like nuclease (RuvC/YqgF family)